MAIHSKLRQQKRGKGVNRPSNMECVSFAISLCILYKYVTSTCMQNKKLEYTHVETHNLAFGAWLLAQARL